MTTPLNYGVALTELRAINERLRVSSLRERDLALELQRQLAFTDAITTSLGESVCALDREGRVVFINPSASSLLRWTETDLLGKELHRLIHTSCDAGCPMLDAIRSYGSYRDEEDVFVSRDGALIPVAYSIAPISSGSTISGVVLAFHDTTDVPLPSWSNEALRAAEARYRSLIEHLPLVTYIEQADTGLIYTSPQMAHLIGFDATEWMFEREFWAGRLHPDDREMFDAELERADETGKPFNLEYRLVAQDGRVVWVRNEAFLHRTDNGTPDYRQGFMLDITDLRMAETALQQSESYLRTLFDHSTDLIAVIADDDTITYLSPGSHGMLGCDPADYIGEAVTSLVHPDERGQVMDALAEARALHITPVPVEFRIRHVDGTWRWLEAVGRKVVAEPGLEGVVVNARDITERRLLEAEVTFRAFHDSLTNLPNRALYLDRLEHALRRSARSPSSVAVAFLDLDNFKVVNDSLGHVAGDALLVEVALRLSGAIRDIDTVARLGGDEFMILIEEADGLGQVLHVAERIMTALQTPIMIGQRPVIVTASTGIVLGEAHISAADMIRHADLAMYTAKDNGKDRVVVFNPAMHLHALHRLEIEHDLRVAIDHGELSLRYQPEIALATGALFGVEALVRWEHPDGVTRLPADFIAVAEETGLIVPLGAWVLRHACADAARWIAASDLSETFALSVNLSLSQFRDPLLVSVVRESMADAGLQPSRLILEITESILADDPDHVAETLQLLRDLGVRIAVDDFGAGYSSLGRLRRIPVDFLKIDRTFSTRIGTDVADTALMSSMIDLAHALGKQVVAEGVETQAQAMLLHELGCDVAQGYLYARPLLESDIPALWSTQMATAASA